MSDPVPSDYDASDGWDESGEEQCPHCEGSIWPERYSGAVIDKQGRRYEHFTDTEPGTGPFFHPVCWDELETNRRAEQNASITEWS